MPVPATSDSAVVALVAAGSASLRSRSSHQNRSQTRSSKRTSQSSLGPVALSNAT